MLDTSRAGRLLCPDSGLAAACSPTRAVLRPLLGHVQAAGRLAGRPITMRMPGRCSCQRKPAAVPPCLTPGALHRPRATRPGWPACTRGHWQRSLSPTTCGWHTAASWRGPGRGMCRPCTGGPYETAHGLGRFGPGGPFSPLVKVRQHAHQHMREGSSGFPGGVCCCTTGGTLGFHRAGSRSEPECQGWHENALVQECWLLNGTSRFASGVPVQPARSCTSPGQLGQGMRGLVAQSCMQSDISPGM